ncbi:hypothetical protein GWI34_14345 [Actinomadura sp. DSM 109109]|nr:hypothetical protein [Actinomadura lepetitiana]
MISNPSHDRDELLVAGTATVASSQTQPIPEAPPLTEAPPLPGTPEAEPLPVFVDASGWRARFGSRVGLLAGAVLLVFLGALGLGMTTGADVPLTPWSEPSAQPRVKVSRPSVPARAVEGRAPSQRPRPTGAAPQPPRAPAASAAPAESAAPVAPATPGGPPEAAATGTATSQPGRSQASPPAWGRNKKKNR